MRVWTLLLTNCIVFTASCMTRPFDGQKIDSRDATVDFGGFATSGVEELTVLAQDPTTGDYEEIARAEPVPAGVPAWGDTWHPWSVRERIPDRFWRPAQSGFFARIYAKTDSGLTALQLGEGSNDCIGRNAAGSLVDVVNDCMGLSNVISVCTNDYVAAGSRRGECRKRTIDLLSGRQTVRRLFQPNTSATHVETEAFNRIAWRGDGASFVDVYDESFAKRETSDAITSHGTTFANYVRVFYPNPKTSDAFAEFNLNSIIASMPTATSWKGAKTVRQYDRGECSATLTWEAIMDEIIDIFPTISAEANAAVPELDISVRPASSTILNPILRTGSGDGVGFFQRFVADASGLGQVPLTVDVEIGLSSQAGRIAFDVEEFVVDIQSVNGLVAFAELFGVLNREELEESLSQRFRDRLEREVMAAVNRQVPPGVTIHRAFGKPEGFEFILAESQDEPLYGLIRAAGYCGRPATSSVVQTGHFDTLFY